jgi:hypothetical protein
MRRWLAAVAGSLVLGTAVAADYPWVDAHLHLVDFFQEGENPEALIEALDQAGVSHAQLSGVPLLKLWHTDAPQRPRYYLGDESSLYYYSATDALVAEAVRSLPDAQRERLFPFISGFNPTDMNAADHVQRMLDLYPGLWRGIGEILARHDDLTAMTEGEVSRADHPALMKVYRLAAKRDLPVLLHSNITSKREREPLYIGELEAAVKANPKTRFIWAHAGTSLSLHRYQGRLDFLHGELERLLATYDNLWIDLSWALVDDYLLPQGKPDREWLALVERHPDRFMVGSDQLGSFDTLEKNLRSFVPFLDALPRAVAERVAGGNFLALMGVTPDTLARKK